MPRVAKPKAAAATGPRLVSKTTSAPSTPTAISISQELIASRAYELFESQGGMHGNHLDHWLKAEQELLAAQRPRPKKVAAARAKL